MNKKLQFPMLALALICAGAGCNKSGKLNTPSTLAAPKDAAELKMKWTPGERLVLNLDMKQNADISVSGQPNPIKQDLTLGERYALTVLQESSDGTHEVELNFLSIRMAMQLGGKTTVKYDSTKASPADGRNPVAGTFGEIIGTKIQFFLDASNNVERMEGADELEGRLAADQQIPGAIRSMFGGGYLKQMMSASRLLPPKAVQPGDTWPVQMRFPVDVAGTMVIDNNYTFQSWELRGKRNCARLEFQGTFKSEPSQDSRPDGVTMVIQNGTSSGVSWFDPELGVITETTMNQDMTIIVKVPVNPRGKSGSAGQMQTVTMPTSRVMHIQLDSVE